ncbi:MAG: MotA/TolQ/ExbB proton channel family protein [Desulfobacterales bacterium]|nr:MotA/TolQ/ExbB proton channel family protein [Desulfobacterales bacterium]
MIPATLQNFITTQDPLILTLSFLSALGLAVIIDRLWFWVGMALRYRPIPPEILSREGQKGHLCIHPNSHYLHQVVATCLEPGAGDEQLAQTVTEQAAVMNAHLGLLDLLAKIAPLIGILGTVLGMATSFGGVGAMASASPTAISSGISVALQTTAYGLIISIACTVATVAFKRLTERAMLKIGRICCEIRQVQQAQPTVDNNIPEPTNSNSGSNTDAGHDLPDHSTAASNADAQLHRTRLSRKLPGLC